MKDITDAVAELVKAPLDPETFPFDLLAIYRDIPKTTLAKLKNGSTNAAKATGGVLMKKVLYFQPCTPDEDPSTVADRLVHEKLTGKSAPRFILVTNGEVVHVRDLKTNDPPCNRAWNEDEYWAHFLLPLNPKFDRATTHQEHPADVKAATTLRRLYEAILKANPTWADGNHTHELNVFMTRVLFCLYAEDTGVFDSKNLFTNTIVQYSDISGSDLGSLLDRLFRIMNVEQSQRAPKLSPIEAAFPYVNGNLFESTLPIPEFDRLARRSLLDCGDLNWTEINPDIFGSMIQTIADPTSRSRVGMHYTSTANIMKVLRPLFLDDLEAAYEKAKDSVRALEELRSRLARIRVFDPACGSGNFLIIAYKELRRLDIRIVARLAQIAPTTPLYLTEITIGNFFGIDAVDLACETARLSLWIAEHQINGEFYRAFKASVHPLPLKNIKTIVRGNALRVDWTTVCPPDPACETYICGNPPYAGYQSRSAEQGEDLRIAIGSYTPHFKSMDYITGWFVLAAAYAKTTPATYAFVSTNSICQGEQVSMLWPVLYALGADIAFAYTSFKWSNSAAHNAGVTCIIVGLGKPTATGARLFEGEHEQRVHAIGPYLIPDPEHTIVQSRRTPISGLPPLALGSNPTDGGNLMLTPGERKELLLGYPEAESLVRKYVGSNDLINGIERYCLWITDETSGVAKGIPPIEARLAAVRAMRMASRSSARSDYNAPPYRFRYVGPSGSPALVVPMVNSERREYLPIGVVDANTIVNNLASAVYNPAPFLLALLSSRMQLLWARTVGGKLKTDTRYSNTLVYNTFPVPALSDEQRAALGQHSRAILRVRARYPDKSLAWLYNPETMPNELLTVHKENDRYIEAYVYGRKFRDDTHRIELLFAMYATATQREVAPLLLGSARALGDDA